MTTTSNDVHDDVDSDYNDVNDKDGGDGNNNNGEVEHNGGDDDDNDDDDNGINVDVIKDNDDNQSMPM